MSSTIPVELTAPQIARYAQGSHGIPYMWTTAGKAPGPHVMVLALTHGNEISGAIAADFLLRQNLIPAAGKLTIGFANVAAYHRFDPRAPGASRFVDEDFNRVWDPETLASGRVSVELARARQIRPLIDSVDYLLDLHSMQNRTPALMMAGRAEKGVALAKAVGLPSLIVQDEGHVAGSRLRDYGFFNDPADPRTALLAEVGQHWESAAGPMALDVSLRFLHHFGIVDDALLAAHASVSLPAEQRVIDVTQAVTVKGRRFDFVDSYMGLEVIPEAGTVIAHDDGAPVTTPYDDCVLIMPSRRLITGQTAVRLGRFVA
ncbi:MAG: succinylglutamate desuccinylase/aspartoacylase family protein [Alphaproteobacteria bacterium]|nr:succinylglutamate desuccinylase/aspartoacylase family protein [Alphaproteobacteria bacterium]